MSTIWDENGNIVNIAFKVKENATIGLLNIGTEDSKGGELQKEAYELLSSWIKNAV